MMTFLHLTIVPNRAGTATFLITQTRNTFAIYFVTYYAFLSMFRFRFMLFPEFHPKPRAKFFRVDKITKHKQTNTTTRASLDSTYRINTVEQS